ncbi:MAG: flagellar type III secretion system protein FliR [Alphaproteobacteria bacterium]|nr:flagellar type III secretion system protein FliR [Alphaproteobacteria bacterium]
MTITLPGLSGVILVYLLVFARTGAMVMLLPAIGDANVPGRVRLMLALAISLALAPTVASTYPQQAPASALALGLLIAQEVTVGILIGTMARIIMSSLSVAGFLIASQTGLSYAETLDPTSNGQQGAVIGNFFSLLGVVLIFATNLHHLAIGAVAGSYHLIPPGTGLPTGDMAQLTIKLVSGSFALGFQLAAPFLVFGFAVNAAFGLLARMMPQLQVFFVAMPVNILVGFLLMVLLLGTMMTIFLEFYTSQMGVFL